MLGDVTTMAGLFLLSSFAVNGIEGCGGGRFSCRMLISSVLGLWFLRYAENGGGEGCRSLLENTGIAHTSWTGVGVGGACWSPGLSCWAVGGEGVRILVESYPNVPAMGA